MALTPLDFPASPTVGQTYPSPQVTGQPTYTWDGADWLASTGLGKVYVPIDGSSPMTGLLTLSGDPIAALNAVTKQYVDAAAGLAQAYTKKSYLINGAMQISQENGNSPGTINGYYAADQFALSFGNAGTQTAQQVSSRTPGGSATRLRVTSTVADASVAAGDYCQIYQIVEGTRLIDLNLGLATAKTVTLRFGVNAPAGTYCVTFRNTAVTRSYVVEYVIAAGEANTDVIRTITAPLDTVGTWETGPNGALYVSWTLMAGTTLQGAARTWLAGQVMGTSNQFNFMGVGGRVFELFDVGLYEGTIAPVFIVPDYPAALLQCQRYYTQRNVSLIGYAPAGGSFGQWVGFPVYMRTTPTIVLSGGSFNNCSSLTADEITFFGNRIYSLATAAGVGSVTAFVQILYARM